MQGQQSEWALLKRHPCEDIFGVQVCGAHPDSVARCVQLLVCHCAVLRASAHGDTFVCLLDWGGPKWLLLHPRYSLWRGPVSSGVIIDELVFVMVDAVIILV